MNRIYSNLFQLFFKNNATINARPENNLSSITGILHSCLYVKKRTISKINYNKLICKYCALEGECRNNVQ